MIFQIDTKEFDEFVKPFTSGVKKIDENSFAVDHARSIELHSEGCADNKKLKELLERRRPNEPESVKEHRIANFRPITKSQFERVENTLHSIFNPRNYSISWPEMKIIKAGTAEEYFTEDFPEYGSLVKYFEQSLFHNILCDPALVLILPFVETEEDTEGLIKPYPYFIESDEILEEGGDYLVIKQGDDFILVDRFSVITGVKKVADGKPYYEWTVIFEHDLEIMPVVKLPGVEKKKKSIFGDLVKKESYVAGVLPYWDKALMNDTDQDAVRVRFAHPKEWEWKADCKECGGKGMVEMAGIKSNGLRRCATCGGTGSAVAEGPASKFRFDPKYVADNNISPPPFGFESPDPAILNDIKQTVRDNINDGFGALNMHHLSIDNTGESGIAKAIGREDLNTFMLKISNGVWDCYRGIVKISSMIRYGAAGQFNEDELPDITKPVEFNLYTSEQLTAKIQAATTAQADKNYIKLLQVQAAKKEFGETSAEAMFFIALQEIDPFPNATPDEMLAFSAETSTLDRIVHANINNLMNQAIVANDGFLYMDRSKQRQIIYELASGMGKEISRREKMIKAETETEPVV